MTNALETSSPRTPLVDVIVPVYGGAAQTRRCIESVLAFPQQIPYELVVIDDCSPELELSVWLRETAGTAAFTLVQNPANIGFVNAVNRGMMLHLDRDVVLLNSDTEVHGNWLERLRNCAYGDEQAGTATPFSNNATLCSYPRFLKNNALPEGWSLAAMDELFSQVNEGLCREIPTAVGFCMYIKRRCLNQVGCFDAHRFKVGYGEENDFCMRAMNMGFKHLLCADTFVYHEGNVSFGESSQGLSAWAHEKMKEIHPHYFDLIDDHCKRDPARVLRRKIDMARLLRSSRDALLYVTHNLGGGTEKHVQELASLLKDEFEVLVLRGNITGLVSVEWARTGEEFIVYFNLPYEYDKLLQFIKALGVGRLHFHHLIGVHQQILQLIQDIGVPYCYTLHDHYSICPQYTLTRKDGHYCGEPDVSGCALCLSERPSPNGMDIVSWRTFFNTLLTGAHQVIVPSQDMLERMKRYIPRAHYVHLMHPEPPKHLRPFHAVSQAAELKILVLGKLDHAKGLKLLESCALDAARRCLPLYFRVIGMPEGEVKTEPSIPLSFSGPYSDANLPVLIRRERPDLIFFPALCPESYSYTLSSAMRMGLPIAAPRLGAFTERLASYPSAWLKDPDCSEACWNDLFMTLHADLKGDIPPVPAMPNEANEYMERYRMLIYGDTVSAEKIPAWIDASTLDCYGFDNRYERNIDTLTRSELLTVVHDLGIEEGSTYLTASMIVKYVQELKAAKSFFIEKAAGLETDKKSLIWEKSNLRQQIKDQDQQIKDLNEEIFRLRDYIKGIFSSMSWKITAPLRSLKSLLAQKRIPSGHAENALSISMDSEREGEVAASPSSPLATGVPYSEGSDKNVFDRLAAVELDAFLTGHDRLALSSSATPRVSIILILYNRAPLTFACLKSIKAVADVALEVVLVDNASSDETPMLLQRIDNARVVTNTDNLGFLAACNQAAAVARGETLLFLNNDAQLLPGSLSSALDTLYSAPNVGAVGGKIVLLDGTLQEAGSIVRQDGSCLGYGRGDAPFEPMYMFRRVVDYCSGAFLLTRREHFNELGGFDRDYIPAYYEETDYCFRLKQRGLTTVYDPLAVIVHYEFGSATDPEQGIRQQARNQNVFLKKHGAALEKKYPAHPGNILLARHGDLPRARILVIDDRVPHRSLGQGFPRAHSIVSCLVELGCFITLYPLRFPVEDWSDVYSDIPNDIEVMAGYGMERLESFLLERKGYYHMLLISRPHNMEWVGSIGDRHPGLFDGVKLVYDAEALFAARDILREEIFGRSLPPKEKEAMIQKELELAAGAHVVITVSEAEREHFTAFGLEETHVLGHLVTASPTPKSFTERRDILFVGAMPDDASPNADSLAWFVKEVFPLVKKLLDAEVRIIIAGSCKSPKVTALESENVILAGFVHDLTSFYNDCRVFIAPTRFAGGIPFKAHEAAAHGLPIAASTLIASQLGWVGGEDLAAAPVHDPVEFAHQCSRLYSDSVLWQKFRENALRRIELECSMQVFNGTLKKIVDHIAA